jgi:hypothetical protein
MKQIKDLQALMALETMMSMQEPVVNGAGPLVHNLGIRIMLIQEQMLKRINHLIKVLLTRVVETGETSQEHLEDGVRGLKTAEE